jgi:uncharacterized protein YecT (DUF1311 family)
MRGIIRASLLCSFLCLTICATPQKKGSPATLSTYQTKRAALQTTGANALQSENVREKVPYCEKAESSVEKTTCATDEFQATDKNYIVYKKAIAGLLRLRDPEDPVAMNYPNRGKEFDESEGLWLRYRSAQCRAVADGAYGGTIQPQILSSCRQDLTRAHLHELEGLYSDLFE